MTRAHNTTAESLDAWLDREYRYAVTAMQRSISRTDLVKARPGFDQVIRAAKGSIVASPVLGSYDPDPDYFFHWFRDGAIVMDALRIAHEDGAVRADDALQHLADFVQFSRSLAALDPGALASSPEWRTKIAPGFLKYVRDDHELRASAARNVVAETRVNPDGTLDISKWARPQHDGPALRALALTRWAKHAPANLKDALLALVRDDAGFLVHHWHEPSYDIWEEDLGAHYYTLRLTAAALEASAVILGNQAQSESTLAQVGTRLDRFWSDPDGIVRSRTLSQRSPKELDISVILAANHADQVRAGIDADRAGVGDAHSPRDPRLLATLDKLAAHFDGAYRINLDRPAGCGPALGRYPGDVYYKGSAWYVATLGAAEFCYRAGNRERGDAFVETARRFTPESGELSEQFDRDSGAQTSAKHLAWSYAAVISCRAARGAAS